MFRAGGVRHRRPPHRLDRYGRHRPFDAGESTLCRLGPGQDPRADFRINEPEHAYLTPAKLLAMTAIDLLYGDAEPARNIIATSNPPFTKDSYLAFERGLFKKEHYSPAMAP